MALTTSILIVDDEAGIRMTLAETLMNDGHQVIAVESGKSALQHIATQEFDLALIDIKLKDIAGTEVLAALRQQSPDTVVIMLTGHATLETAIEALRQDAHDYLFKPFKTNELRESIRKGLLNRQQALRQRELLQQLEQHMAHQLANLRAVMVEQPTTPLPKPSTELSHPTDTFAEEPEQFLRRGRLIVDFKRHLITVDERLLELSLTEFNLMAYLISKAPRVISPQELVRQVHGYDSEPWEASETVRSHIYHIRQKSKDAAGGREVIRTIRGVGYTIEE
ncbi:MAG: response regulator transcription factor [Chloroflexi bacterium]|nr:response regulator transcription factor [Chloroflexota bacterium]